MLAKILTGLVVVAVGAAAVFAGGAERQKSGKKFKIEFDNAFGLTSGGEIKVGGVKAGKITKFGLSKNNRAIVYVEITEAGFGAFTDQTRCNTRPQSVIGEYFVDCEPGRGKVLKSNATIPVSRTRGTIAPDLVANILRLPYRERLRLIVGELGAGAAANGENLNAALKRAVPALDETDKLLKLLGDESGNIRRLVVDADTVLSELARNKRTVVRFVTSARRIAQASADRREDIKTTFRRLPAFLTELRPTMVSLGRVADGQGSALQRLASTRGQLRTFFRDVRPFADASKPALASLAEASRTGSTAVKAARPTVRQLNKFARKTPEVGGNLSQILRDLDDRGRAVENDRRAASQLGKPGQKLGYTGIEALLQYVFNQSVAINAFDQNGHLLRVNAVVSEDCGPYTNLKRFREKVKEPDYEKCKAWIGPNQPAINSPDPSDKSLLQSNGGNVDPARLAQARRQAKESGLTTSSGSNSTSGRSKSRELAPGGLPSALDELVNGVAKRGGKAGAAAPSMPGRSAPTSTPQDDSATELLQYLLAP